MSDFPQKDSLDRINWDFIQLRFSDLSKVDRRRGGTEAVSGNFTTTVEFAPTGGDSMRFAITPSVNVWWEVEYRFIMRALDTTVWVRGDAWVTLDLGPTTVDADGVQLGSRDVGPSINASGIDYRSAHPKATFKLEAGKPYTARCVIMPQAGTWNYWMGLSYTQATAKVVGFW